MWNFRLKASAEKIRNPIQGEFFATEAIDGPAQALVRESVQNSLDARLGAEPVHVRFTLRAGNAALAGAELAKLFDGAWPHFNAPGNGLHRPPAADAQCPYLLIEDFGTKGLTGDPEQSDPDPDLRVKNPFFLFFRAEGLSTKTGTELGRWGIGKFVFPRSSHASAHFGLTIRHDDRRQLLLGAATLKAHRIVGSDAMFSPDGLYGSLQDDGFVLPIEDGAEVERFRKLFGITRTESGLSVVVPFVDAEITFDKLLEAACTDYFVPILDGRLQITIDAGSIVTLITADTIDKVVAEHGAILNRDILGHISLARFATAVGDADRITLKNPDPVRAAKWSDGLIGPDQISILRSKLLEREPIAIRVPVSVRTRSQENIESWFDIHLLRDKHGNGRPLFVREGLIISDVRGRRARETRSLVTIDHKPLAAMLGDSENPAHTQWQKDSSNFKGRYLYGSAMISFVANSVSELLALVNRMTDEADATLTVDFFSIPPPEEHERTDEDAVTQKSRANAGDETTTDPVQVQPRPPGLRIVRVAGGFSVLPGSFPPSQPYLVQVRCAYDIRSGNPLKKWHPADFTLGPSGVAVACSGGAVPVGIKNNVALLKITHGDFEVKFTGFDVNRDVYVRATQHEVASADSET